VSRARLPIDDHISVIHDTIRRARAAVIVAAPGAGKTTRVPPALALDGRVIVLQPRRVAARAIAARIASEQGWTLGHEVGWHVRFERRFSERTRLLLATEGILTARLLQDPLLSDFDTIVLDEFHERSLHADLGVALARQAWLARDDLRLVVMSATIDPGPVTAFLGDCPVITVPGRTHPVDIGYAPGQTLPDAVRDVTRQTSGSVLCFLPGAPEIQRAIDEVTRAAPDAEVLPLHGSLDAADQDRALQPSARRRVILATNIAETSLTVPGVTAVIDGGFHKVARYDSTRGIDSLDLERISQDAADQRAGRAGRLAPGVARRLWSASDRLRPRREPDIMRIDLAAPLLDLLAWGGDPDTFDWFEAPPPDAVASAWALLRRLGAVEDRVLTLLGRTLQAWPLHPRLGRILLAATRGASGAGSPTSSVRDAARICALLAERQFLPPRHELTTCDLFAALDDWPRVPPHIKQVARQLEDIASRPASAREPLRPRSATDDARANDPAEAPERGASDRSQRSERSEQLEPSERSERSERSDQSEVNLRRAILAGYPDRVARRREPGSPRVLLASGHGAALARESGVQDGDFLVALDVQAATAPPSGALRGGNAPRGNVASAGALPALTAEARIRIASLVSRDWLRPTHSELAHWFDPEAGRVKAARRDYYDAIVLSEHPQAPDPAVAAPLLADAYLARGPREADAQLVRRIAFADLSLDLAALVRRAAAAAAASTASTLDALDPAAQLTWDEARELERRAPESLRVPSGRSARLDYEDDGGVSASVKLQELFGLADTPRVGARQAPVLLKLLAPNGRPVQTTRDLRSFWDRTYPEVRKELRGRYPRHPWPDDPWSATPTARTTRRQPGGNP
jgi:ATP-dependent helicase HrpB